MFLIIIIIFIVLFVLIYFILDYRGPGEISLQVDYVFNFKCFRAKELIVQEFDNKGKLWASRGMIIYCLDKGADKFIRTAHVPTGLSFFWLNNFTFFRRLTIRPECVEMTIADDGTICAFTSGKIWIKRSNSRKFVKTMKLPHFGIKVGRGLMSTGLLKINKHRFLFGEYFSNPQRTSVKIYEFENTKETWKIAYEFLPGEVRHIHALQKDPYTGLLWVCTGDEDKEAMIGWSANNFKTIVPIGKGSQKWRTCQLVFTENAVYWGADTGVSDEAGIYRWDKESLEYKKIQSIEGAIFFGTRLASGAVVMSTDRERFPNEVDDKTRLIIIDEDEKIRMTECGSWDYKKPGFRFNFAKLRFQRTQGGHLLAISCLNQKEIPDGDLIIINEKNLT